MGASDRFWVEMELPTGGRVRLETRSHRALQAELRFLAVTQSARPVARGPLPLETLLCARCRDLFVVDGGGADGGPCPDCAEGEDD